MKLSLKNGEQTVKSWRCIGIDKERTSKCNLDREQFSMRDIFNCKGKMKKRAAVIVIGLLFLLLAVAAAAGLLVLKLYALPYYLDIVIPAVLFLIGVLCVLFPGKYLSLTVYMHEQKEDLISIRFNKKEARFDYLNPSYITFKIKGKDANSVVSKLGSVLAKYDLKRNERKDLSERKPQLCPYAPFFPCCHSKNGYSFQADTYYFSVNPFVLELE